MARIKLIIFLVLVSLVLPNWALVKKNNIDILGLSLRTNFANYEDFLFVADNARFKLFLGYLLLNEISAGEIESQEELILYPKHKMGGAGNLQYQLSGAQIPILKVAEIAIQENDDTAANMLLDRLGGYKQVNNKLAEIGFEDTKIKDCFPNVNQTSEKDLVKLITQKNLKGAQAQIFKKWLINYGNS